MRTMKMRSVPREIPKVGLVQVGRSRGGAKYLMVVHETASPTQILPNQHKNKVDQSDMLLMMARDFQIDLL